MKRKLILMGVVLVFTTLFLTGCGEKKPVLNVYNWGDYIDDTIIEQFEEEYGISVNYEMYASNEDLYVKLKQGATSYDVVFPSDYMVQKLIKEDLLLKYEPNTLGNYKNISDEFKNLAYDENNEYSVPYLWGTMGIVYNKDMVDEADMDSWDALFSDKYKDMILLYDTQRDIIGMALKKLGYSINTKNPSELAEAKELIIKQKELVSAYVGDNLKNLMLSEEAAIALDDSGDALQIIVEGGSDKFGYKVPKEGSNIWVDAMVIPKNSEHAESAKKFIDFMCRKDVATKNVNYVMYSTPNKAVDGEIIDILKNIKPTQNELDKSEVYVDLGDFIEEYNKAWVEIKAE